MSYTIRLSLVLVLAAAASAFPAEDAASDGPLLLTPYIEAGKIDEARKLALVKGLKPEIVSYSGLITVDKVCDSNIFFWFFPSESDAKKDPVSVWLNGGPGSSSMFGLLTENGPYALSVDGKLSRREYAWNRNSSIMFVDNPVGVGYSYTKGGIPCYSANETHVGQNFVRFLDQFFKLFPELQNNPFYLTGESYAGKYVPAIAYTILKSKSKIRLEGLAIGNGLIDPINQLHYAEFFYQLGFIDSATKKKIEGEEEEIRRLVKSGKYAEAGNMRHDMIAKTFGIPAGFKTVYNFLVPEGEPRPNYQAFLQLPEVRKALHVGNIHWDNGTLCRDILWSDLMQSMRPWLETLMDHYRVLLYYGQMDMRDGYTASMAFIEDLKWKGSAEYNKAKRKIYYVGKEIAGYSKSAGNFTEMMIRNAGHFVPTNQPKWALDMYNKFIFNVPF
ncbi:UNVERIFIED_CONTAM: hypothetical protein PYX00_010118 [Menopon gallinae]|uniref:Carboxypeptidase n=1 Tax=Menopon gallinae TaxID=328185 RepID=A0AAW2HE95_9NEOP